ncbi:universal stress protein [Chloroflexota bacterium]
MVPLDGSVRSEAVIPYIRELASRLEVELTLVQVVSQANHDYMDAEDYLKILCGLLEEEGVTSRYEVKVGAAADEIINLADELNIDLVAMSTHGRTGVGRFTLGSVAQKVLFGGNTPILLVRD